jgi:adenylate cyclase
MISPSDILRGKILIVDDLPANVLLLEQTLRGAGYLSVTSTMESGKVCELHLLNRYDLILLDLQMPGMDGFQVMENLKEIETSGYLPVLVVTALPGHKLRALRSGARDFVSKPLDLAEVLIRVHNMLEVRLLHLESSRLNQRVLAEQEVSKRLLLDALPRSVAASMKRHPRVNDDDESPLVTGSYAEVTVLFSDILAFTRFAEGASAQVLTGVLDGLSTRFDALEGHAAFDRTKTIGEAYLAALGLSDKVTARSIEASEKAVELVEALDRFNGHSRYQLKVRIGLDGGAKKSRKGAAPGSRHDL